MTLTTDGCGLFHTRNMAYLRRYRRALRRPIRRTSRFNRYTRRFSRNLLASYQQRDIGRFTIRVRLPFTLTVQSGSSYASGIVNIWSLLGQNPQYTALKTLYDQIKINGVRVNAHSQVQFSQSSALYPVLCYSWDRNGVTQADFSGTEESFNRVASYGSSRMQTLTNGARNILSTQLVAQDIQERTVYIPTEELDNVSVGRNFAQ